jgi:hypothetical protein
MRAILKTLAVLTVCAAVPSSVYAQASIAGVVRDASGAVLPGVTVEAASPVLIEKVRSVVSDGSGQYRIVDLRPGSYSVTFTLPGFATVRREGIVLTGTMTATVNADMRVGGLEETITVTGETPIVDVQGVTQQRVLDKDVVDALPTGRTATNVSVLIPGISLSTTFSGESQDVGGTTGEVMQTLSIHGSRGNDQKQMLDGLSTGSEGAGHFGGFAPNMGSVQEVVVDTAAVSAEQTGGGVRVNLVPREGGNVFSGSFFFTGANEDFQGDNINDELRSRGTLAPSKLKSNYDVNPAFGGPIVRDKLWFFAAARWYGVNNYIAGAVANANAGNPNVWTYSPDPSFRGSRDTLWRSLNGRVTWQASTKHKLSFFYDDQSRCSCPDTRALTAPESTANFELPNVDLVTVTYSAPLTSKVLIEAGFARKPDDWAYTNPDGVDESRVGVFDFATGLRYHGPTGYFGAPHTGSVRFLADLMDTNIRGAASYVTGTHAFKVGFNHHWGETTRFFNMGPALTYVFNTALPAFLPPTLFVSMRLPYESATKVSDGGIYAQDRWTMGRLTLNLAARWDYFHSVQPEVTLGPAQYFPTRNLNFPEEDWADLNDITPKVGAAYDLFGDGRTAIKASIGKYVANLSYGSGIYGIGGSPTNRTVNQTLRSWSDANRNFNPDCDLTAPGANGECGPLQNLAFGTALPPTTNFDPEVLDGWGKREYNWETSVSVQQQIIPNLSVDVGYFRRWYGNFITTDNLAVTPADFNTFSVAVPTDNRLPASGETVSNLFDVAPALFGRVNNFVTLADNFGDRIENWQGVDLSVNARLRGGTLLQGGISTGRTRQDSCDVRAALPETAPLDPYCRTETPYLTQAKFVGAYTIPVVDVQAAVTVQSIPGPQLSALVNYPSAVIAPSLGRPLAGNTASAQVNVVDPGSLYGDRLNQLDLRLGKILRFGRTRTAVNLDVFNVFNANAVLSENSNYAAWRQPTLILNPRLLKISVNFDF